MENIGYIAAYAWLYYKNTPGTLPYMDITSPIYINHKKEPAGISEPFMMN